ncbi:uncharacterized protein LOC135144201 [Zophobas morio]|uniref:uncharacterized protein LOC135144201 n=1 Tax=Zophobas morio TaxID=2755281 RepID=UPI003082E8C2
MEVANLANLIVVLPMVLAGLMPDVVIDICGRALSFWNYQTLQDRAYQEAMVTSYKQKINEMRQEYETAYTNAVNEINRLQLKTETLQKENREWELRYRETSENNEEKSRKIIQLQNMCSSLKSYNSTPSSQLKGNTNLLQSSIEGTIPPQPFSFGGRTVKPPKEWLLNSPFKENLPVTLDLHRHHFQRPASTKSTTPGKPNLIGFKPLSTTPLQPIANNQKSAQQCTSQPQSSSFRTPIVLPKRPKTPGKGPNPNLSFSQALDMRRARRLYE